MEGSAVRQYVTQAVTAYRAALEVYTREELPQDWAMTQNDLVNALAHQGKRTSGEESQRLLAQAVTAYRAALEVYTREELAQDWAMTQNNLGNALRYQGTRTGGEESRQLLAQAVTAYRAALEVYTRDQSPQNWAGTQNNLGNALSDQGTRTDGEESGQLLEQAVTAYEKALEVRTPESFPERWAETQNNLAQTYMALAQWAEAAQSLQNVLRIHPDSPETYKTLGFLYHERLFDFQAAFALHQAWLERHSSDFSARADGTEALFTVGRFADAEVRLEEILGDNRLSESSRVAVRALAIAALLAQGKKETISQELQGLLDFINARPADFRVDWSWAGTIHFVQTDDRLAPLRDWLLSFFEALQGKDRKALFEGLQTVVSSFATLKP